MRKANLWKIHDGFESDLEQTRERLERLESLINQEAHKQLIPEPKPQSDLTWLFEAACMAVYARWVAFTQELFVGLLNRDASELRAALSPKLPEHLPMQTVEALLTWKKNFPTNPDDLKGLAKEILAINPFSELSKDDWRAIGELHAIRNVIAHPRSPRASKRLPDVLTSNRRAGTYLKAREQPGSHPRLVGYIERLIDASKTMRTAYAELEGP